MVGSKVRLKSLNICQPELPKTVTFRKYRLLSNFVSKVSKTPDRNIHSKLSLLSSVKIKYRTVVKCIEETAWSWDVSVSVVQYRLWGPLFLTHLLVFLLSLCWCFFFIFAGVFSPSLLVFAGLSYPLLPLPAHLYHSFCGCSWTLPAVLLCLSACLCHSIGSCPWTLPALLLCLLARLHHSFCSCSWTLSALLLCLSACLRHFSIVSPLPALSSLSFSPPSTIILLLFLVFSL